MTALAPLARPVNDVPMKMPCPLFPEMMLRAAVVVPPICALGALSTMPVLLKIAPVPAASVPIRLP